MAVICPRCGGANADGTAFCQLCGARIPPAELPGGQATEAGPVAWGPTEVAPGTRCTSCGTESPAGTNFCQGCGIRLRGGPEPAPAPAAAGRPTAAAFGVSALVPGMVPPLAAPGVDPSGLSATARSPRLPGLEAGRGRLVTVRRDGSDGAQYPLVGEQIDIGRTEGDLMFDDPHLARRHARILVRGGEHVITPLDTRNGVYVRVRNPVEIADGDYLLLGKQVLRFELVPEAERNLRPAIEHGIVLFGTPCKLPWGRLRQLTAAGTTRDIYHLCRGDVIVGREQGDIVFSEDEFLSRRHAQLSSRGARVRLEDLGSSNGTFVRLRGPHPLAQGEMIRLGDELLRFELG